MDLQPFDLLFYKGESVVADAIKSVTQSNFSHVAVILDDKHLVEIDWYYKLKIRHIEYDSDKYDIYRLKEQPTEKQKKQMMGYIYSHSETKYDFKEIIAILFYKLFKIKIRNNKRKLVCSSFVNECFKSCGITLKKGKLITPQDLISNKIYKVN